MEYEIPKTLLDYFKSEALINKEDTLAICLGYFKEDTIHVQELIFPNQENVNGSIEGQGKTKIEFDTRNVPLSDKCCSNDLS